MDISETTVSGEWLGHLAAAGARIQDGRAADFGSPADELAATAGGSVVAHASHLGLIRFYGADAADFLHGQLSCAVKGLANGQARVGAYCTPKGRMLATFLLWRADDGFMMTLDRGLVPSISKRLRMFVLRSKVTVEDRSGEIVLIGIAGPGARSALEGAGLAAPSASYAVSGPEGGAWVIGLPAGRFLVAAPVAVAQVLWSRLSGPLRAVGEACWRWLDVRDGFPWVAEATQDQFVPQMANLELIGGIDFQKGCYPGQEIVARTQYLGSVKRRMYRGRVEATTPPGPGDDLFEPNAGDQTAGTVVTSAPSPRGGFELLAVLHTAAAERGALRLRSPAGPVVELLDLPYPLP